MKVRSAKELDRRDLTVHVESIGKMLDVMLNKAPEFTDKPIH